MIGEAVAAFLGALAGSTVGARVALGAWPWSRHTPVKPAGAEPAVEPAPVPRPAVIQLHPPEPPLDNANYPTVTWTSSSSNLTPLEPDQHPLDVQERNRKWAARRRRAESAARPVGL